MSVVTKTKVNTTQNQQLDNKDDVLPEVEDSEIITAGEQFHLATPIKTKKSIKDHEDSYEYHNHHHHHHPHPHHHNDDYDGKYSEKYYSHDRQFHENHPNLPNPFTNEENEPTIEIVTPQPTVQHANTLRPPPIPIEKCEFECGDGKCIANSNICDGVNHCENKSDENNCNHLGYEVRLTGGLAPNMGRVEVKISGNWGHVCDDKFGMRDADVVCRELGFNLGASEVRGNSYYPVRYANFIMDEVECLGNETSLRKCEFSGWGVHNCDNEEIVGVVCKVPLLKCPNNYWLCTTTQECIPVQFVCDNTPDCTDKSDESELVCQAPIKYRLEGGRSQNEGRLEIKYRGVWGTVCDDDFELKEAKVACHALGYFGKPRIDRNIYGPGSGPIWLDQVACFGNETTLEQCTHLAFGEHNCNHTEDVGLYCSMGPPTTTTTLNVNSINLRTGKMQPGKDTSDPATDDEDIGLYPNIAGNNDNVESIEKHCGRFKKNIADEFAHRAQRVINGTLAKRGNHPWQATIRARGVGGISSHWCGAVLITKQHLLTAAHCLVGSARDSYFIRLGDHYSMINEGTEKDAFIERWYIHEKFRDGAHMNNDIALILLKRKISFTDYIQPICLPSNNSKLESARLCTISGWGSIKSGVSTPSTNLRAAEVPILADKICQQEHVYGNSITSGMFCAGTMDANVDACDGDSGGPLSCTDGDAQSLYGIISWGQHCGFANKPGVYVRVEKYIDWIFEKINMSLQHI